MFYSGDAATVDLRARDAEAQWRSEEELLKRAERKESASSIKLVEEVARLNAENDALRARVAELETRLKLSQISKVGVFLSTKQLFLRPVINRLRSVMLVAHIFDCVQIGLHRICLWNRSYYVRLPRSAIVANQSLRTWSVAELQYGRRSGGVVRFVLT